MRWMWVLLLPMAGCLDSGIGSGPALLAETCDLALPDGTELACEGHLPVRPVMTVPDGFLCTAEHETDETGGTERTYAHPDGRVGVGWSWPENARPGTGVITISLIEGDTVSVTNAHFGTSGFVELPMVPEGTDAEVRTWMRFFDVQGPDLQEATLHAASYGGVGWFWWELSTPTGTLWVDLMKAADDPESSLPWFPGTMEHEGYNMTQWAKGVHYKPGAAHLTGVTNRWCPAPLDPVGTA